MATLGDQALVYIEQQGQWLPVPGDFDLKENKDNTLFFLEDPNDPLNVSHDVVVCVVCGGVCKPNTISPFSSVVAPQRIDWMHPWLIQAKENFMAWCKQPWTAKAYKRSDNKVLELIAVDQFFGGSDGFCSSQHGRQPIDTYDSEMRLPIHGPCLELATVFCAHQSRFEINFRDFLGSKNDGVPTSIAHLYEIWMKRALMADISYLGPMRRPIPDPNDYFGAVVKRDVQQYIIAARSCVGGLLQEVDPSPDRKRTSLTILSHAVAVPEDMNCPTPELAELQTRFQDLPPEMQWNIEDTMEPFNDLGPAQLVCTRVLPNSWWKQQLFEHRLFPWLYDLDISYGQVLPVIRNSKDVDVDWELLCRQLAQPDVFQEGGMLHGRKYLENRHRIWRLLDSARLGHFLSKDNFTQG
ncbi:hypothetical protein M426DRAFT_21742 [Hypoxylon sp. CI-4A]|nr:hypothetical protein M426DRAFT_21742 [Hypoxylon sp. CI-4A]